MGTPNFDNRTIFHGDNLPFLRNINSESVKLIATDPPFNKKKDFHAAPDSKARGAKFIDRWRWEKDVQDEWVDALNDDWPETWHFINGVKSAGHDDMAAFLCWLGVRLMECKRILRPDGSIYLHIDHTAQAYAKVLMDTIFGRKNFRNEIVWSYRTGGVSKRHWPRKHDSLLFYAKSDKYQHHPIQERVFYEKPFFTEQTDEQGRYYADVYVRDTWDDIKPIINVSKERTGYPTQKPVALYERIIKASSNEGDIVLDPFCGCATTPVAAERLGRHWIGMDIWEKTHQVVLDRLNAEKRIFDKNDIQLIDDPDELERTDDADPAADYLPQVERRSRQSSISRADMLEMLVHKWGCICWGCGFAPPAIDYLELDHIMPASDGGSNELPNRAPLCGPCNRRKSNTLTLTKLRRDNKRAGRWYATPSIDQRIPLRLAIDWARDALESHPNQGPPSRRRVKP